MNDCKFTGRFVAAPRRKDTDKTSRCFFTLMVNKKGKRPDGTKYPAQAVDFVAWGKIADLICQYKEKGHLVLVSAEYGTYEVNAVDFNNNVIEGARKHNKPMFTVLDIEFMPVNNGQANVNTNTNTYNQNNASNINPSDIPSYDSNEFPDDFSFTDSGISFDNGSDMFSLGDL